MKKIILLNAVLLLSFTLTAQCFETLTFGAAHTVGKKSNGTLWGWGWGDDGQLLTLNETEPLPIQLGTATDWSYVKNGVSNTFAIKNNGTLWGCGSNQYGMLGVNSSTINFTTFQQITTATNWVKVAPSQGYTLALKADGTIWGWGQNDEYQLGNSPATAQQLFPIQVGTATDWVEIATGTNRTSFAIKANGTIWGWGSNPSSIIVNGSSTYVVTTPTQVGTASDWKTMSVGSAHVLAQKTDSTLWSWGGGPGMGLGGTVIVTNTPQQISTAKWKSFSAGTNTSFAVKADGTLWAWGLNTNGQLANGNTTNQLLPVQIGTDNNWATVQARNNYTTMATKTDGTVWYWGYNYYGEFGNGSSYSTAFANTPTQTVGICVGASAPILVSSIAVQGQGGVSAITTNAGTLQMQATVLPANATDPTYTWSVNNPSIATISATGMLTAVANGTVTVTATANDASGITDSTNIVVSNQTTAPVLVSSIAVQGQGGVSVINTNLGTLQMQATVLPTNATDPTYTWSVNNPAIATISATGMLTAVANGTLTVTATANDASGITDSTNIVVSNQTVGLENLSSEYSLALFPNPASDQVVLKYNLPTENAEIEIVDLAGRSMGKHALSAAKGEVNVITSAYQSGMYMVIVKQNDAIIWQQKLVIE